MGHMIRAIIGKKDIIEKIAGDWVKAQTRELPQGFSLLFLTNALYDDIEELMENENMEKIEDCENMVCYTTPVVHLLKYYSFHSQLVYIETDYAGGYGTQAGALFVNGKTVTGPVCRDGIINQLLKDIGVYREHGKDEFDSLCLGIYRRMPF